MTDSCLDRVISSLGLLIFLIASVSHVRATSSPVDPFAFFQSSVAVTADDRKELDEGHAVAHVIGSKNPEVAVWAAVPVNIDGDRLVAWMRRIEALKKSAYVMAIGRFSNPPRLDDLIDLSLDDSDAADLAACHPGHCDLKLSAVEMTALQDAHGEPGALQQRFRQVVLDRVNTYLSGGRIGPYADTSSEVWPAQEFDRLVDHSTFLTMQTPSFARSLRGARATSMPGVESFLYWSKENLGGKTSINVTDVRILRGDGSALPDVVVAGKQIFATHYINASLGLTALVHGDPGRSNYLVYVNRSGLDVLHGKFAGIVRWYAQRRLKAEAGRVLEGLRTRLESSEPPPVVGTIGSGSPR